MLAAILEPEVGTRDGSAMSKGYAEGSTLEERLADLERAKRAQDSAE
jgi:hypothetical protein